MLPLIAAPADREALRPHPQPKLPPQIKAIARRAAIRRKVRRACPRSVPAFCRPGVLLFTAPVFRAPAGTLMQTQPRHLTSPSPRLLLGIIVRISTMVLRSYKRDTDELKAKSFLQQLPGQFAPPATMPEKEIPPTFRKGWRLRLRVYGVPANGGKRGSQFSKTLRAGEVSALPIAARRGATRGLFGGPARHRRPALRFVLPLSPPCTRTSLTTRTSTDDAPQDSDRIDLVRPQRHARDRALRCGGGDGGGCGGGGRHAHPGGCWRITCIKRLTAPFYFCDHRPHCRHRFKSGTGEAGRDRYG